MDNRENFKKIIKMMESSGGKNLDHDMITKGSTKGQTAGGAYGIVPSTLSDVVNQLHNRKMEVDPRLEELSQIAKKDPSKVTEILNKNRDLDELAADHMTTLLENKTGGDINKMAYAWNMGHNRDFSKLNDKKLNKSTYFKKFSRMNKPDMNILDQEKFKPRQEMVAEAPMDIDPDMYTPPIDLKIPEKESIIDKSKSTSIVPMSRSEEPVNLDTVGTGNYAKIADAAYKGKIDALKKLLGH